MFRSLVVLFIFVALPALCFARQNPNKIGSFTTYTSARDLSVQQIVNLVNTDSLILFVRELSGDTTTTVNGSVTRIITRRSRTSGNALAQAYLAEKLGSYGLSVELHHYDASHPTMANIIGVQQGSVCPRCSLIVCAHFDDIASGDTIPGADDNASGSAAVLEAARILSAFTTSVTVVYALWNDEESGSIGSTAYASRSSQRGDSIIGVINIDMIGFDSNNDGKSEIHTKNISQSVAMADTMVSVNRTCNLGLAPITYNPGAANSDNASFWLYGYGAIWLIEAYWSGDLNPGYHTVNDKIQKFNRGYFGKCSKLAIGTVAALAGIEAPTSVDISGELPGKILLFQNYPNPFNPVTTIKYQVPTKSRVTLRIYNLLGQYIRDLKDDTEPAGYKHVDWNASSFASGIYFYRLEVTSTAEPGKTFTQVGKMLLIK